MRKFFIALATAISLSGCAGMYQLSNDVSTYSQWPADRKPATYAFERLPSQQAHAQQQQRLEDAASRAIEGAGFTPAANPASADVLVQLGARVSPNERYIYDDPLWWRGGLYHSHFARGYPRSGFSLGLGYGMGFGPQTYEREVALLIRDRKTGQVLFEAHASNGGASSAINSLLSAMFEAAMKDFPHGGVNPRRVVTTIAS